MSAQPPYGPPTSPPPGYYPPRSNRPLIIAAAVAALIIIGGLGYWLGGRNSSSNAGGPTTTSAPASGAASATASSAASTSSSASTSASGSAASAAPSSAATTSAATTSSATTTSASPTATAFSHPDPDFGYLKTVTTVAGATKLTFDRATLLTGAAAASAAKAHGQTVEDDYFIVNDNPLIRTFPVSPSVVVVGSQNLSGGVGPTPSTLAALEAWVTAHKGQSLPVDLGYDAKGTVTTITEKFFP